MGRLRAGAGERRKQPEILTVAQFSGGGKETSPGSNVAKICRPQMGVIGHHSRENCGIMQQGACCVAWSERGKKKSGGSQANRKKTAGGAAK